MEKGKFRKRGNPKKEMVENGKALSCLMFVSKTWWKAVSQYFCPVCNFRRCLECKAPAESWKKSIFPVRQLCWSLSKSSSLRHKSIICILYQLLGGRCVGTAEFPTSTSWPKYFHIESCKCEKSQKTECSILPQVDSRPSNSSFWTHKHYLSFLSHSKVKMCDRNMW